MVLALIIVVFAILLLFSFRMILKRWVCSRSFSCLCELKMKRKIRILVISDDSIMLCPRDCDGNTNLDTPLEIVVGRCETVENALCRLLSRFPAVDVESVRFCLKYKFANNGKRNDVFLFVAHVSPQVMVKVCDNCVVVNLHDVTCGKVNGVFSNEFVEEYPHVCFVVDVWRNVMNVN